MYKKGYLAIFLILMMLLLSACTWVKLSTEGHDVSVAFEEDIKNCLLKGETTVNLKSTIAGIDRSRKKVKKELTTLGRNSAANIGGDTIVPASEIENGKQTFKVYDCSMQNK